MIHLLLDRDPWFRQKRLGYGATPSKPQGWALVASYVALMAGLASANARDLLSLPVTIGLIVAGTALFLWIVHRRTEGGWTWRWGK